MAGLCACCALALQGAKPIVAHRVTIRPAMLHTALSRPGIAAAAAALRWPAWLGRTWAAMTADDVAPLLGQACSHADLERRLRRLERGRPDRFGPLPPGP